jgi:type I restriction enzyme, S subunit
MRVENNIPEGWLESILGEVISTNDESLSKNYPHQEIIYIDTGSVTKNKIEAHQVFNLKEAPSRAKRLVRDGDIIYSTVRPDQEHYGYLVSPQINCVVSTGFCVIRAKNDSDSKFIYYFLTQRSVTKFLHTIGEQNASTYPSINPHDIEKLVTYLPPLPEQKAIAKVLTAFDDKIELLQAQNKTLETMAQTIFKEWFGKYQIGDELPEGWRVGKLGEEFKIIMGQSPSGSSYNELGEGDVFFQGRAEFTSRFPSVRLFTTEPKRMASKFDILVSVRAPVGDINVAHTNCCIGRGLAAVSSENQSYSLYKLKHLKPIFDLFESEGTVFGSINKSSFESIETIIPKIDRVKEFNDHIKSTDLKIYENYNQIQSLTKTRDTLLPKLMSGQVRVKNLKQTADA